MLRPITAAVLLALAGAATASGGSTPQPTPGTATNIIQNSVRPININAPRFHDETNISTAAAGGEAQAISSASGGVGSALITGTTGGSVNIEGTRLAQAPDVMSYPTAPCRVSVGVSGGWFGGAIGFGSSVRDDECVVMEASRRLDAQGQKAASVQIMCLIPEAKLALEATGTKCMIERPAAMEPVKP